MEPPPCIQNAMLTKDKKPFTYTPGGLNLSEIRSPRMARRIERNAAYEGVGTPPPSQHTNRPQFDTASLPPSTLAAMQPQMHVQVFPTGPPPPPPMMARGGAPPPPPPPPTTCGAAPPPPPLPTQKFRTADQQVVERPDMTKIIPENPMTLLKKTGGPRVKNTLLEEAFQNQQQPPTPQVYQVRSPPAQMSPPIQQQWSPKIVERVEPPKLDQQKPTNVGTIYIPPLNKNEQIRSPPTPQSPKVQSPCTPTLKEAPRPWQQKKTQQEDVPEWAKKETSPSSPIVQEQQQIPVEQAQRPRWPQNNQPSPKIEQNQQFYEQPYTVQQQPPFKVQQQQPYREPQPQPYKVQPQQSFREPQQQSFKVQQQQPYREPQQQPYRETQQQVYREPQQQAYREPQQQPYRESQQQVYREPQQQPYRVQQQHVYLDQQPDPENHPNAVYVTQPIILQHPGSGYGPPLINRRENVAVPQQQGNSRIIPVQVEEQPRNNWSNSFKKMQSNDSDQELLNRFKQVPNDPGQNRPQVRNIPIQIEGGGAPSPVPTYVPPSQQTPAEEPKKYTGSSIPSRSFRILQAMTAHDSCANAKDANENYDPSYRQQGPELVYPHPYPLYPPYWPPFYPPPRERYSPVYPANDAKNDVMADAPAPPFYYWCPPLPHCDTDPDLTDKTSRCSSTTELENIDWRKTPVPYWNYPKNYEDYAPFCMPYYYPYPPFYPQLSYDDVSAGYSSTDEMSYYAKKTIPTPEIIVTPTPPDTEESKEMTSDSDTDTEINDETTRCSTSGGLQTIKSVTNIQIYEESESDDDVNDDDTDDESSTTSLEDDDNIVPHQLSIIFEVSERTEISRNQRENSVTSDCSTTIEEEVEEEEDNNEKNRWNSENLEEIASRIRGQIDARIGLDEKNEEIDMNSRKIEEFSFPNYRPRFENKEEKITKRGGGNRLRAVWRLEDVESEDDSRKEEEKRQREEIAKQLVEIVEEQQREFSFGGMTERLGETLESNEDLEKTYEKETEKQKEYNNNEVSRKEIARNLEEIVEKQQKEFVLKKITRQEEFWIPEESKDDFSSRQREESLEKEEMKQQQNYKETTREEIARKLREIVEKQQKEFSFKKITEQKNEGLEECLRGEDNNSNLNETTMKKEDLRDKREIGKTQQSMPREESEENQRQFSFEETRKVMERKLEKIVAKKQEEFSSIKIMREEKTRIEESSKILEQVGRIEEITKKTNDEQRRIVGSPKLEQVEEQENNNSHKITKEEPEDKEDSEVNSKESSDSEDWWGVIGREEDDFPKRKPISKEEVVEIQVPKSQYCVQSEEIDYNSTTIVEEKEEEEIIVLSRKPMNAEEVVEIQVPSNQYCVQSEEITTIVEEEEEEIIIPSIKDRIKSLQDDILSRKIKLGQEKAMKDCIRSQVIKETKESSSTHSTSSSASSRKVSKEQESSSEDSSSSSDEAEEEEEMKHDTNNNDVDKPATIKQRIESLQKNVEIKRRNYREDELKIKSISTKSSEKSFDEISEEDSGVTDMSRHYSDHEEFPELRKMSKYQRAATHSRLFQLLQEECENDDDDLPQLTERKNQLTLPLISDKLADELVTSALRKKKGQIYRNMSMEKLHAAARKILQEDTTPPLDTPSEGFSSQYCSPLTENSENEYARYYESWSTNSNNNDNNQLKFTARCPMTSSCPFPAKS